MGKRGPKSRLVTAGGRDALGELGREYARLRALRSEIQALVVVARLGGATWAALAVATGEPKSSLLQRHGQLGGPTHYVPPVRPVVAVGRPSLVGPRQGFVVYEALP